MLKKLLFTFLSLLLLLLAIEGAVRLTDFDRRVMGDPGLKAVGTQRLIKHVPYLQWRNRAGAKLGYLNEYLNSRGFRGPEVAATKPGGVVRIAVLGDSCSFGVVRIERHAVQLARPYATRLQEMLDRRCCPGRAEVINYSSIGYTSYHGVRVLRRETLPDDPGIVIIRFGWNDHLASPVKRSFTNPRSVVLEELTDWMYLSRLFAFFAHTPLQKARDSWDEHLKSTPGSALLAQNTAPPVPWVTPDDYAFNLSRMADMVSSHGAIPIFLDAPPAPLTPELRGNEKFLGATGYDTYAHLLAAHRRYQAITEKVAREKGVRLIKTLRTAPEDAPSGYFSRFDLAHPTGIGQKHIAGLLYAEISGLLARGGREGVDVVAPPRL